MGRDKLWLIGGVAGALVLVALGFFVFISPKKQDKSDTDARVEQGNLELVKRRKDLAALDEANKHLATYQAELATYRAALPATDSVAQLLREFQDAGSLAGVTVSGVNVGTATDVQAGGAMAVHSLPISLTAAGPKDKINPFIDQLQKVQSRAVLISTVNLAASSAENSNEVNLTISLQAFYATSK